MDPLSTAASVIAVIQLCSKVVQYTNSAAGARKERQHLRHELRACENILQELRDEADDSEEGKAWTATIKALEAPGAPLGRLWIALQEVEGKLRPKDGSRKVLASLEWPFNEREIKGIFATIEREKSLLELALANNSRKLIQEIKRTAALNTSQLAELIQTIKTRSDESEGRLSKLKEEVAALQHSQVGLLDGLDRLHLRQDSQALLEERSAILNWLAPVDYSSQQRDFIRRRQEGTGKWLLKSEEYQTWLGTQGKTLFCPGIPGAGKTSLASIVIDDLSSQFAKDPTTNLAYIYCTFQRQNEQSAEGFLTNLLKQLVECQSSLPESVKDLYKQHRTKRPSLNEISTIFHTIISIPARVFVVVDAMDECQESDGCRNKFLSELFDAQTKYRINLLVTSRFIPDIVDRFRYAATLEIRASSKDVERYVEGHLDRLRPFVQKSRTLQQEIITGISNAVDGMFLLAQLYLHSLDDKTTPKQMRKAITSFGSSASGEDAKMQALSHAYEQAMERINGQKPGLTRLAMDVLAWVTCARRPLTVVELQHALALEAGEPDLDEDNLPQTEDMAAVCAGLVVVDEESGIIRLVHYTAQEYFEWAQTQGKWFPDPGRDIAVACVTYLSFDVFSSGCCHSDQELEERLRSNPLYNYASCHWGYHACKYPAESVGVIEFLEDEKKVEAASQVCMVDNGWSLPRSYHTDAPETTTALHLASYFGIHDAVASLLPSWQDVDSADIGGWTPLSYAAVGGHAAVIRLLLNKGADTEKAVRSSTPLCWAAANGHMAAMRILLENGAEVDAISDLGRTCLSFAAEAGYADAVRLLLDSDAAVDQESGEGRTPLSYAAGGGHEGVVRLLIENSAVVDMTDNDGLTPLGYAAIFGHEEVVRLLIENNATVDMADEDGLTPLGHAAAFGKEAVVRLLIDNNAAVDMADEDGLTPLGHAAASGKEAVVRLLVDKGATINTEGIEAMAPLLVAAYKGHEGIIRLLLDKGAEVVADPSDKTPLLLASEYGHGAAVQWLLEKGTLVEARDTDGRTLLSQAAECGHDIAASLFISNSAMVEARNRSNTTALGYAIKVRYQALSRALVDMGASVNAKSRYDKTPLVQAAVRGDEALMQFLLDKGANIETEGYGSRTPLFYAVVKGHQAAVQLLLGNGAAIETRDHWGATPLALAARCGREAMVHLLLDKGACIDAKDDRDRTPLIWAAFSGYEAVVQLLIDRGAAVDHKDWIGRTALQYAVHQGHKAAADVLKQMCR